MAGSGEVYAADDDLELIRDAVPFGLKTYESLLATSPHHRGLLLAAGSGFTQYAYAFVQSDAERIDSSDHMRARELRARAHRLYLRGRGYALRGLESAHAGFIARLHTDRAAALTMTGTADVPFLYWAGVAWAGALTVAKDDLQLLADLPTAAALVQRVLELDETYDGGAAHEFFITYEGSRPIAMGGSPERARQHYRRALELSAGQRASVHLALAEAVAVRQQNLVEFRALLEAALAVDPDTVPRLRLANTLAHRRAQWLMSRIPDLFIEADQPKEKSQ
jgi:predicted anti-sigma-YlaC factor YlaD